MIDSDETASIPLRLESDGTLKMFALYPVLQEVLERGSVLFIDELNARLHPLLVKNFIQTFLTAELNPHRAQLVLQPTIHGNYPRTSSDVMKFTLHRRISREFHIYIHWQIVLTKMELRSGRMKITRKTI